ncbi:MAG: preprotein translocase subunit YajC [Planctomycetes bacterium]|nr:preprotein translocase subunit YajC [Planctomycetota bacterium]
MHRIVLLLTTAALILAQEGGPNPGGPGAPAAPGAPGAAPQGGFQGWGMLVFLGLMVLMMWFMVIRPQKKEEKRRKEMVDSTKRGDEVVTIGGVHGTIEAVGEATVDVRIGKGAESVVATFNKGAISSNLTNERAASAKK